MKLSRLLPSLQTLDLPYKPQLTNKEQTKPLVRAYRYGVDYRPSRTSEMPMYSRHVLPLPNRFIWEQSFAEYFIAGRMTRLLHS